MANAQHVAAESVAAFLAWASSKTDDDFREYIHRGCLNRTDIAKECGFGTSAVRQNPALKAELSLLEDNLRARGVLPATAVGEEATRTVQKQRDTQAGQRKRDGQRLNNLEQENASLRAELSSAKSMLERYQLMAQFMDETGRIPR
ncbi:VPA1267 family protein [Pseudomonas amygdali]|uniref:VPA1267 family protein n=1 Tax=Pseudomonas amygdali TaxID=47877 RepID=UPI0006B9F27B|nr:VPA1267 family protein [Pseudomonas amygdali]RMT45407.1 hypothetical protein ALP46_200235 [Pseudomonas amygdali pv. myricae]